MPGTSRPTITTITAASTRDFAKADKIIFATVPRSEIPRLLTFR